MSTPSPRQSGGRSLVDALGPRQWAAIAFAVLSWAVAVGINAGARAEDWRWVALGAWVFALAVLAWTCTMAAPSSRSPSAPSAPSPPPGPDTLARGPDAPSWRRWLGPGVVIGAATALSFAQLADYPLGIYGDPVRDSGLTAVNIATGAMRKLFGWGAYNGQGLSSALVGALFVPIFGADRYTILVPAALLAIADVTLFYVLARRHLGTPAAEAGALLLACAPLHLYFARRDPLIVFSSLWMTLLLFLLARVAQARTLRNSALLALGCGLAMTFHASAKGAAFVVLALLFLVLLVDLGRGRVTLAQFGRHVVIVAGAWLVGYGPMLVETTPRLLLTAGDRVPLLHPGGIDVGAYLQALLGNLWRSWTVYIHTPTTPIQWFPEAQPLLPGWMGVAFVPGLLVVVWRARVDWGARLLLGLVVLLPLSHSALTDTINDDHRLLPLLPVAGLVSAAAVAALRVRAGPVFAWLLVGLLAWGSVTYVHRFFAEGLAGNDNGSPSARVAFALAHVDAALDATGLPPPEAVHLWTGPGAQETLGLLHMREYLAFYWRGRKVALLPCPECAEGEYYAAPAAAGEERERMAWRTVVACQVPDPGRCGRTGLPFVIHVPR